MDDRVVAVRIGGERAGNEVAVGVEAFAPSCAPVLYLRFSRPEPAQHVAARVEDGRGRAGQELVRVDAVLMRVNQRGHLFEQRSADGFLAFRVLGPVRARRQRALSARCRKLPSPTELQVGAVRIGQHDHAVGVHDLLEQHVHHRRGVGRQALVAFARHDEVAAHQRFEIAAGDARQPIRGAAPVRLLDDLGAQRREWGPRRPQRARRAGWLPRGASGSSRRLVL